MHKTNYLALGDYVDITIKWLETDIMQIIETRQMFTVKRLRVRRRILDLLLNRLRLSTMTMDQLWTFVTTLCGTQELNSYYTSLKNLEDPSEVMQAAIAAYSIHHNTNDCVDWLVEMTKWTRDLPIIS